MFQSNSRSIVLAVALAFAAINVASATIIENWDSVPTGTAPVAAGTPYSLGDGWTAMASGDYATQGTYLTVGPDAGWDSPFSSPNFVRTTEGSVDRDQNTTSMIVLSPQFSPDGSNNPITMELSGGNNGSTPPTSIAGIGSTLAANGSGWEGVALLDSNGNVLETAQRSGSLNDWQSVSLPTVGLNPNHLYQVAMIDTFQGGWGWIALDDVSISGKPTPEPCSFILGGLGALGLLLAARRRKTSR